MRSANQQPAFDFLTGAETSDRPGASVLRERQDNLANEKQAPSDDRELIELKAEIKSLKYSISTTQQEQELAKIRQESEIRDIRRKADEDFKKMQQAEGERLKNVRQYEQVLKEYNGFKDTASNERAALEKRLREAEEGRRLAEEEIEETRAEKDDSSRTLERKLKDLEASNVSLRESLQELQQDAEHRGTGLQNAQQQLHDKDVQIGTLESEILKLKSQSGDAEAMAVIKKQFSEQVYHVQQLEMKERQQSRELEHFRALHKSVEIVEEEKRALQRRLDGMENLEQELGEARLQRQRLEDERLAWTAYLQSQAGEDGQLEFDSPEALAHALVDERFQTASLIDRLGSLEPQLSEKDLIITALEEEKRKFHEQLEKVKSTPSGGDAKAMTRLTRQKALAVKEVEYLRAQLKALDNEESTMELPSFSEDKSERIQKLEDMVEQYRIEVQTLHDELAAAKIEAPAPAAEITGAKRARSDGEESEQLGQLLRKNRKLQDEISKLQISAASLQKELSVTQERLKAATQHSKTRILSLRNNPTSEVEAIKFSTLSALRAENAALLAQLQDGSAAADVVPVVTLEAAQRDLKEMEAVVKSKDKHMTRLKQIWGAKTLEFREGVSSLLGWKVDFLPNGKMKVTSLFYPSTEDNENSIVFDGENGKHLPP